MVEGTVKQAVDLIKDFLRGRNIVADNIVVFGSYARGDYRDDSDIDIAIISRDFEGKDIFQKADMLKGLRWALVNKIFLPIDIVLLSLSEWTESTSLTVEFIKSGKILA
jgi:predicted nucleotidyltransferase